MIESRFQVRFGNLVIRLAKAWRGIIRSSTTRADLMAHHRDRELDAARGLAMLLVVYGHLLQPLFLDQSWISQGPAFDVWRVIYAFHMPFFFLLCGVTDNIKGYEDFGASGLSALKLLLTALAFSAIGLMPQLLNGTLSLEAALLNHLRGDGLGLAVLWFLIVLGLVRVIYAAALAAARPYGYWLVLAGSLAVSWLCSEQAFRFWQIYSLVGALPFYVAGRRFGRRVFDVSVLLGFCSLAVLLLCAPSNLVHVATGLYGDPTLFAVAAVAGCWFMLMVVGHLRGMPRAMAAYVGRASFELYIVSGAFLVLSPQLPGWDRWIFLVLLAAVGLPLHMIAAFFLRRPIRSVRKAAYGVGDGLIAVVPAIWAVLALGPIRFRNAVRPRVTEPSPAPDQA
ncbi:acyltransferase family protein [Methylobacterium sp. P1-11]|uniref:acyltransferase family protein n=1 Tax=Methylobacterium sp. P1-11 TaxID=2024616 RepID=UPI001FF012BC|nr:acyltransferase family protein [Methylobacterium sp. P1-11]